jgi:hypothetical protein
LFWQTSKNSLSNFGDFDPFFPKQKKIPFDPWHWIFLLVTTLQAKFRKEREKRKKKETLIANIVDHEHCMSAASCCSA